MAAPMRMIVVMLVITSVSELCCFILVCFHKYTARLSIYHFYNIVQAILITSFFIFAIKPERNKKISIINILFWILAGIVNLLFFQPLNKLNSNMLILESFFIITFSLYFIYNTLKSDITDNIFGQINFRMALILLVYWSSNMFFWAFIKVLNGMHWKHIGELIYIQAIFEIVVYVSTAFVIFDSTRKKVINGE